MTSQTVEPRLNDGGVVSKWDRKRAYGVKIKHLSVLLPVALHCELVKYPSVVPMPNSPAWFAGVLNLRGNLVPVYDLAPFLEQSASSNSAVFANVIVVGEGDSAAALICHSVPKTFDITHASWSGVLDDLPLAVRGLFNGGVSIEDQMWFELDPKKTFSLLAAPLRN